MLTLLLETSTDRGLVAIGRGDTVVLQRHLVTGSNNAQYLLPTVQELLAEARIDPSHLQCIAVGVGPGSYTGIRVAVMAAKGLAFAHDLPLVGVPSLMGFLPQPHEGAFAAVIDAKIGGVYLQIGRCSNGSVQYLTEPAVKPLDEALVDLKGVPVLVTPKIEPLRTRLEAVSGGHSWEWQERGPDAQQMLKVALQRFKEGKIADVDYQLEILYLRKTQAEIERSDKSNVP